MLHQGTINLRGYNERNRFKWSPVIDGPVARIPLKNSDKVALVDVEDLPVVTGHSWRIDKDGYAITNKWRIFGKKGNISMHRVLTGFRFKVTDHVNRDKLDNRRCNLREATWGTNQANKAGWSRTGFKGVYQVPKSKTFRVQIMKDHTYYKRHGFLSPEEAAKAYETLSKTLYGEFACTEVTHRKKDIRE